uniref:Uncharacterized protein n=2 Tax=Anguilla anguilla TaxID=7936 RepID=A0A0E9S8E4_ANGAN
MKYLQGGVRKLSGQQMPQRGLSFQPGVDIQFSLYQLQLLLQRRLVVEEMMGVKVRSLYYLFGGMLCLGRRLLMAQVSCQILQLLLALL